jgi:ketosteroid isomerase-like protein
MGQAETIDLDDLRRGYAAIASQDWDTVMALYDAEIEWIDPPEVPDGGVHVGLEAVRASWENYLEALEDWALEPQEILLGSDEIFVRSRVTGRARIGGAPLDLELFQVWTARNGKLVRHRGFLDRARALEAAGLDP